MWLPERVEEQRLKKFAVNRRASADFFLGMSATRTRFRFQSEALDEDGFVRVFKRSFLYETRHDRKTWNRKDWNPSFISSAVLLEAKFTSRERPGGMGNGPDDGGKRFVSRPLRLPRSFRLHFAPSAMYSSDEGNTRVTPKIPRSGLLMPPLRFTIFLQVRTIRTSLCKYFQSSSSLEMLI